jgi:pimeloyl-ACP methyl ester carboxylesterase
MRGYNLSDAPQETAAYTLDTLAAGVVRIADAFGADRFHLVGHDWGAVIGWWVEGCAAMSSIATSASSKNSTRS